jgi:NADH-quinone oxidoreductase subunit M
MGFALATLACSLVLLAAFRPNVDFEVRLMPRGSGSEVPAEGKNLIIVGTDSNGRLNIRIFDAGGGRITDTDETRLPSKKAGAVAALKQRLPGLLPPHVLAGDEKARLIDEVTSITDQTLEAPQFSGAEAGHYGIPWVGHTTTTLGQPDIRVAFGLDGISLLLFVLTSLLTITAICCSWESIRERVAAHYGFLLALETGLLGLFASLDVILFYIFFEFTLIPLFFLIGIWGGPQRRRASVTFFLYTLVGSLLTLLGVIALVAVHYQYSLNKELTFSIPALTHGLAHLDWPAWREVGSWASPQVVIFLLLLAGFAIKVPMFPFHTWLPLAHVEAPTAGSVILAGVLLKVGSYGLLRFNLGMTPLGAQACFSLIATLAVIGIIYGALAALAQTDVKRLVAYSSVSHMGFIVLGLFSMNQTGIDGAVVQMLNHGLTTGALFAFVGVIYERYHTRSMDEMSGLWNRMPLLAFFLMLSALGSAALPGLNGFVGEFPILVGAYAVSPRAAVLGATGMILGAFYLFWMVRRVLFGPLREPEVHDDHGDATTPPADGHAAPHAACPPLGWHEIAGLAPLMFLIVAIGIYPRPIFERIQPATRALVRNIDSQRERLQEDADPPSGMPQLRRPGRGGGGASRPTMDASPKSKSAARPKAKASQKKAAAPAGNTAPEGVVD